MKFQGTKVVIIGGSSGIGLATARAAVVEGAEVLIASRSEEKLRKAKERIPGKVEVFVVDAAKEESVKTLFEKCGACDHLFTPGSEGVRGSILSLDAQAARMAFDSKFWGQYFAAKYGAPKIRPGGSITFMAGAFSQRPAAGTAVLAAINSAIEGLGRALAVELSPIRVNVVSPGLVDTPNFSKMPAEQRSALFKTVADSIPAHRIGEPEDIAQAVLYLMSNGYTTGHTLFVDGGMTLR
jgi:NAD(P)-dependent dehydrogenase (short-subunit alcohol dehydrogenase family)